MGLRTISVMHRHGFNLIELLVVITIIGVLLSMLMPVAKMVREASKGARCMAHQRQLHLAVLAYAEDHDGEMPPSHLAWSNGKNEWWMSNLAPYLEASRDDVADYTKIRRTSVIWGCPNLVNNPAYPTANGYGMNPYLELPSLTPVYTSARFDDLDVNGGYYYKVFRISALTFPSSRPTFCDSTEPFGPGPDATMSRHLGKLTTLYADGHCEMRTYADIRNQQFSPGNH